MNTASHHHSTWLVSQHTPTAATAQWQFTVRPSALCAWHQWSCMQPMACSLRSFQIAIQPASSVRSRGPLPAPPWSNAACRSRSRLVITNAQSSDRAASAVQLPQSMHVLSHVLQSPFTQQGSTKQQSGAKQVKKLLGKDEPEPRQPMQQHTASQLSRHAQQQKSVKQAKRVAANQQPVPKRPPPEITHIAKLVHPSTVHASVQQLGSQPQKRFKLAKQLQRANAPARSPAGFAAPTGPAGWASLLAVAVGVYGLTRLALGPLTGRAKQQRLDADHTHLQSLAAAAAASAGHGGLLTVPSSVLGGALQEVEQHALQLSVVKQQAGLLAQEAASIQQQLAESLRESEENLAQALQTVHALECDLAEVGSLLASQASVLSSLTEEAAAVAAAHRSSLAISQRKVALLESTVDTLQQRLEAAGNVGSQPLQGGLPEAALAGARAELAAQVDTLRDQLENAQGRLAAAETCASELESQLQLLTSAQQALGAHLAALERDASAAATAVKEAVASAETCFKNLAADSSDTTPSSSIDAVADDIAGLRNSIEQREADLLSLQQQLVQAQQQQGVVADSRQPVLSAAVAAKAVELEDVQQQLEQHLEQARSASETRRSELAQLLADASSRLAAARQAAEDKRAELAAIKGSMGSMFSQLMGQLGAGSVPGTVAAGKELAHAAAQQQVARVLPGMTRMETTTKPEQEEQQAEVTSNHTASKAAAAVLRSQLSLIETAAGSSQQELELLLSMAKISWSPEKQALFDQLQLGRGISGRAAAATATSSDQLLQLLRSNMSPEMQAKEAGLRQELAQLQQEADQARQQLAQLGPPQPTAEEVAAAAAAEVAAAGELQARQEAQAKAAAEAKALAATAKAMLEAKTQAALKLKADAEAKAAREAAAAAQRQAREEAQTKAAAEARARAELEARAVAEARAAAAAKATAQEAARAAARAAAKAIADAEAMARQQQVEAERQAAAAAAAAELREREEAARQAEAEAQAAAEVMAQQEAQAAAAAAAEQHAKQEDERQAAAAAAQASAAAQAQEEAKVQAAAEQETHEAANRQAAFAAAEAMGAVASALAAAQRSVATTLAEADMAMQAIQQQQPSQQLLQQQPAVVAEQLRTQLRVLSAAKGLLLQQAEQLVVLQDRCEEQLADIAASDAETISRELADLQMSLAERQAALSDLIDAAKARLSEAKQAAAAAVQKDGTQSCSSDCGGGAENDHTPAQQTQQHPIHVSADSYDEPQEDNAQPGTVLSFAQKLLNEGLGALTSSSSSNRDANGSSKGRVLSPPSWDSAGKAAVLFLGKAAAGNSKQQQQQPPSSPAQPAANAAGRDSNSGKQDAADNMLLLAQQLLDQGLGALTGNSSTSSTDSNQGPDDTCGNGDGGSSSSTNSRSVLDRRSPSPAAPGGRSSPTPPAALPMTAAAAGAAAAVATELAPLRPASSSGWKAPKRQQLRLQAAGVMLPHPAKAKTGGEDAFFVSRAGCGCLGVADGVGSWAEDGIDAAAYAEGLMAAAAAACERSNGAEGPREVLAYAQKHNTVAGSCTCLVAILKPSNRLDVCLVGDTGLRLVRGGQVVMATEVQEHAFNTPFQLAHLNFLPNADTAGMGLAYSVPVNPGDVLVAGSDGLFDNLWDDQLAELVTQGMRSVSPSSGTWDTAAAAHLARRIAEVAAAQASDRQFRSPWAVEVAERVPQAQTMMSRLFGPRGGKMDDITVVVALVT